MQLLKVLTLRGPNIWSRRPCLEAWVDLQELKDSPSNSIPGFADRLMAWLPTMIEHRCGIGERGGFFQRLREGTWPAHILEHVALELQTLAGTPVGFGKARETSTSGVYKVVIRYKDEQLAKAALHTARELVLAAMQDRPFDVAGEVKKLRVLADSVMLGPSSRAIVGAAEARSIPVQRLNSGSLVQLGYGVKQRRVWTAETDRTGAIAEYIACDKELTKRLLSECGVPVPAGRPVATAEEAWEAALAVGTPVVVKPVDGNHGRGVFIDLKTEAEVKKAFAGARVQGSGVLVERFAPGNEHRLLVVGDRLVAAARGEPAYVTGDGRRTVKQLVDEQLNSDPRRGEDDSTPLSPVEIDEVALLDLEQQGFTPDAVPPDGTRVLIQRNGNVAFDCTDEVHPEVAAHAVLAAKVVGLDIAGIDLVCTDISRPLEEQGGAFVEVNAGPGLHMHLMPATGKPRPVGEAIVGTLFPEGQTGRIPIACVTGTNGKTTVARLLAHLLRAEGRVVGLACTDGISVGSQIIDAGDCAGPRSARKVLLNPRVETAVFEAGRGGMLREGLGFDRCDVAVVTNLGDGDHLGEYYIDTPEAMFTVKRSPVDVVLPTGTAVLNAADPLVADMAGLSAGGVTFFSVAENPLIASHRAAGKRAVFVRDGTVILAEGAREGTLASVAALPMTHGGRVRFQVENALAAAGAAWAMGLPLERIRQGLESFGAEPHDAPARFNLVSARGAQVVLDDCHNSSALAALIDALGRFAQKRRTVVYSAGPGRRDADLVRQGEQLASAFDRVILYDDAAVRDRAEGEVRALLRKGIAKGGRVSDVVEIPSHREAVQAALGYAGPDDLVVVQTEDAAIAPSVEQVKAWAAAGAAARSGGVS